MNVAYRSSGLRIFYYKKSLPLLICLLFKVYGICAQPQVVFKRYGVQDGLSHNYARKIIQDSEGFIWIATEDGLNKFDGYTFKVYKNIPDDKTSLTNHPIMDLVEDDDKNIWVATWGGGVFIYNRKLDNFKRIRHNKSTANQISSNYIYKLYKDSKGRIWIGTNGNGLDMLDLKNNASKSYTHNPNDPSSISNNRIITIIEDKKANLWIGTVGGGLNYLDLKTNKFTRFIHDKKNPKSISGNEIFCLLYDSKDRLWVGTWDFGLNRLDNLNEGFIHFSNDPTIDNSLGSNQVWSLAENKQGQIWIGTDNGLALFNELNKTFKVYRHDPFDPKSLSANPIKTICIDDHQRIWAGTNNNGISMYDKHLSQMGHYYRRQSGQSISYNDVTAFVQDLKGNILVGTDGGGLNIFDRSQHTFTHFRYDYKNPTGISNNKIKALLIDKKERVWIAFWGGGLDYFDAKKKTFTHYKKKENATEGLINDNVTSLAEDLNGNIWLGTFGGGLIKFDPEKKTFKNYTRNKNPDNLGDNYIWTVMVDHKNNVWAGTSNGKLYFFDQKQEQFHPINLQRFDEDGFGVMALHADSKKRIWVGLEGGGLKLVNPDNFNVNSFTQENGLISNNINSIEEDWRGNLWLGTNHGIVNFDPDTRRSKSFDESDGAQGLHYNRQSSYLLNTGEMLFGGTNGFNMFFPDSLSDYKSRVPIVFIDFQIFNKPVLVGNEDSPLKSQINQTKEITLSYNQSVFSIEYAGLNYTSPEKLRYKYRLKGFVDESWQEVGKSRKVTYTNLKPGTYAFEVSLDNPGKETIFTPKQLTIIVTPPIWQTTWLRSLVFVTSCVLLFLIYYLRSRSIRIQNKKLEKEVTEQTMELREANEAFKELNKLIQEQKEEIEAQSEELVESNEEIRTINLDLEKRVEIRTEDLKKTNQELDNFVYRVSHDIRAPLSSVLGLVSLIEKEIDPAQMDLYLKMVTKSVNKLDGFVKDILDYSRNSRMKVNREVINFEELIQNTVEELQFMENAKRILFTKELDITLPHYNDSRRLHIILRNIFSNAIKYQNTRNEQSFINIKITTTQDFATIIISDNGIGIESAQIEKVFDMFYRGSDRSSGSGLGLYIVKEAVEKLNGTIKIHSELGQGTTITLVFPSIQVES